MGRAGYVKDLRKIAADAATCTRCPLHERATQTVFGEGSAAARVMLVGEQPGDQEDKQGHPFVGPAGHLLDRALADSGISRADTYVTNAVKHFKWQERGKRRIHQRPNTGEIKACRPWLDAELGLVGPRLVVLLGAVAGESLFGSRFRVGEHKGQAREATAGEWHGLVVATIHPSAVLRGPDPESRDRAYEGLVADLSAARKAAAL
ncbi:MAG: UdgX family uracil-DNA binding protein [Streptosporangiaceae bacterium]|nr:UdgX family uracil-DNA binding protein [Streptosporangiaceae bacterium]